MEHEPPIIIDGREYYHFSDNAFKTQPEAKEYAKRLKKSGLIRSYRVVNCGREIGREYGYIWKVYAIR